MPKIFTDEEQAAKAVARTRAWRLANPERYRALEKASQARRRKRHVGKINAAVAARKAHIKVATPPWANLGDIAQFYEVAAVLSRSGMKFHVDHVVPLREKTVNGLHTADNLQVIPAKLNQTKHARF